MSFEITKDLIAEVKASVNAQDSDALSLLFAEMHHADIAEILEELSNDHVTYVIKFLDSKIASEVLMELDDDLRENVLKELSAEEIAKEVNELDTDDAADIIAELPTKKKQEVMSNLDDVEHAKDIVELLRYDEDSAGGLMAKELIKANENWTVIQCVRELRKQAEEVDRVHSIYVVDDSGKLKGRLSLKDLLMVPMSSPISEFYKPKVDSVTVNDKSEDVVNVMSKYDLSAIPVVDEIGVLVGRITIDDIVDVIRDEADKDYQMAAGLTEDVESSDSIFQLSKARLPWLILGMFGGIGAAAIMGGFEEVMEQHAILFFFTPLIAAMAGNVGVQSSAIIVQGIANNDVKGSILSRLGKEFLLAILNGLILSILLFIYTFFAKGDASVSLAISISLFSVIVIAGIIGTFIPLFLDKRGVDPAIATGPFITTSNDIFGILIYFTIAKMILNF